MILRTLLNSSVGTWKNCTGKIGRTCINKKPLFFLLLSNSSSCHHNSALNTNCLASYKHLLDFCFRTRSDFLKIKPKRLSNLTGTLTMRENFYPKSHIKKLSSQTVKGLADDGSGSEKNDTTQKEANVHLFCLSKRRLISVSGEEAASFLQGLMTNDINRLQNENRKALYTMILNVQGRVLFDIVIYSVPNPLSNGKDEDIYYLECDAKVADDLIKFLKRYKIRRKVTINDLNGEYKSWASFSSCEEIKDFLSVKEDIEKILICENDPRVPEFGSRLILPHDASVVSAPENIYHSKRYQLGIGEGTDDLPAGNCYPLECNLHFTEGVSFQKGCYIGQELTARTHHRGVVRKRLMPIIFESEPEGLNNGDQIVDVNGKNVGKFRHNEGVFGIALLRVGLALKANENNELKVNNYKLKTLIPDWWPKHEI